MSDIIQQIKRYLEFQVHIGCGEVFLPVIDSTQRAEFEVTSAASPPRNIDLMKPLPQEIFTKDESLEGIRADLGECTRCPLSEERRSIVFGEGNPLAELMFIGEGPGAEEDKQGLPFVGKAGELLTKMIKAMKLERSQVYIANIVKCRPPHNRDPLPLEIQTCFPFLQRQINCINPKVIVALGRISAHVLLNTKEPISLLRGNVGTYRKIKVMPTFHPSYLLRANTKDAKREAWEDLKHVMRILHIPL